MHSTRNWVLPAAFMVLAVILLATACTFGFLDNAGLNDGEPALHYIDTPFDGGFTRKWYDSDDLLQYFEEFYVSGELVIRMQSYTATGTLKYGYLYQYDTNGNKTLLAYYDSSSALAWYQVFIYTGDLLTAMAEYDATNTIQWSRQYLYGTGTMTSKILVSASFDETGLLDGCAVYTYDAATTPRALSMTAYGSVPCGVTSSLTASARSSPASRSAVSRALATFIAPTVPAYETKTMPDQSALNTLGVSSYTFWQYDGHGSSEIILTDEWYPTKVSRTDDRIDESVAIELSWDTSHRITRKKSWYGSTLALDVTMSYTEAGLPLKATTTGAAMLLPLEYELTYDSYVPTRLAVSSSGTLLQYFEYEYENTPDLPTTIDEIRSIDPFAFLEELKAASFSIKHYDGDDTLVETFKFTAENDSLRVDVIAPNDASNGHYLVSYDAAGLKASLACYGADDVQQWSYSYGYEDAVESLETAAVAADIDLDSIGRLAETYVADSIADGSAAYFAEYAQGFLMDLLF